jgi:hypothetical protein
MSRIARLSVAGLLFTLAWTAPAFAGDAGAKARGIVTAIRDNSIMINLLADVDVVFRVDANTTVVARGAGTKMRQAKALGESGVKLSDILPIGAGVEVSFEQRDGQRYATRILSLTQGAR